MIITCAHPKPKFVDGWDVLECACGKTWRVILPPGPGFQDPRARPSEAFSERSTTPDTTIEITKPDDD